MSRQSRRDARTTGGYGDPSWVTDFNRATTISSSRVHRYGRRSWPRPSFRDNDFWERLRSHGAPHATDSHRGRERMLRAIRDGENRRIRNEDEERSLVPEEVPITKNVLTVKSVDLHVNENTRRHRTFEYDCTERSNDPRLVVRRGELFIMAITFQRPWHSRYDDLFLQFSVGDQPDEKDETLQKFQLSETDSTWHTQKGKWAAKIAKQEGPRLTIYVYTAPDAIIGEWECQVTTSFLNAPNKENFTFTGVPDIYVLFNPWCPDDQVYYTEKPTDLDEYVLNEYGCVFMGVAGDIGRKPWYYGQFQDGILDICMTILRMAFDMKISKDMGDAIAVARKLSRILRRRDCTHQLEGQRSDPETVCSHKDCCEIWPVLGFLPCPNYSATYISSMYFYALPYTVCRALGLPSRSLTNFQSAHDTDRTATIDSYKDENGEDLSEYNADSIWNFHCWNDVWINRHDLDSSSSARDRYSGWHALDATPQEKSEGRYQCGPSPLKAIKNGEVKVDYDTGFIFAEVNGELCTWMLPKNGSRHDIKLLSHDPNAIGKTISTKIPDGQPSMGSLAFGAKEVHEQRLDITHLYKYPEGSEEERAAVQLAVGRGLGAKVFETPGIAHGPIRRGHPFRLLVMVSNPLKRPLTGCRLEITGPAFPLVRQGFSQGDGCYVKAIK
ncbi:protein-glutamine gamma-glutamyltransferase k [Plakobranchus ocellatus]|uniref:Protein-glutamine gamma-glutamyltransferase k n=1 Tax=Plakobranchus ocellatus TaxID=259542 RepID=A0AAV4DW99_9GAST|nr:protein-glutamine gamma-glutamyltransferase k [Plakobranchus ocellatus]